MTPAGPKALKLPQEQHFSQEQHSLLVQRRQKERQRNTFSLIAIPLVFHTFFLLIHDVSFMGLCWINLLVCILQVSCYSTQTG